MAPPSADKKRKAVIAAAEDESDSEGSLDGLLDGVLSDSEESDDEYDDDGASNAGLQDGEDDLNSDDVPSEGDDGDEESAEMAKLSLTNGGAVEGETDEDDAEKEEDDGDRPNYRVTTDARGGVRYVYDEVEPAYDSDDSVREEPNTIGNIPLSFYDSYPHIGYDINGKKIMRPATGEALDALLDSIELPEGWTNLTDPATGKPLKLSREELALLRRVHADQMHDAGEGDYDPYPDTVEYFTSITETMPLSAAPEPKRRFVPSKHEAVRIAKLARAIREGRILPYRPRDEAAEDAEGEDEHHYDLWHDEVPAEPHVMHIPAPKLPPPGHA